MSIATLEALVLSLISAFFSKNQTAEELGAVLPQILSAYASAKAGAPFSVTFPVSVDGVAGTQSFSWTPNA